MPRPNILFVLTDDQGYGDMSCHGNPVLRTPGIDALHADAVRLTDFHVGPTCAPTRATLLTGHYANSTGVWHTIGGRSLLRDDEWTLADALRGAGYRTALFGKWHLGDNAPYRPIDRGFDHTVTHGGGGIGQTPDHWGNDYFDDVYAVNGEPQKFDGYCTDVWFQLARDFIAQHRNQPWFCMITPNAPHSPFNVEPEYAAPYAGRVGDPRARFYGMIANLDENLASLRAWLAGQGLSDDTIVVFMTDNGTSGGASVDGAGHVTDGFNAAMRGMKGSPYDGGHRTPCFVHHPAGGLTGGRDVTALTASIDIMPTLLDLCRARVPEDRSFDGTSLADALAGRDQPELADRVVVTDSQRVPTPIKWRQSAAMSGRWRLVNGVELYDLAADPGQRTDLAAEQPGVVGRLREGYESWWGRVSGRTHEPIPIHVGRDAPTLLTAHDWRNAAADCPWHQGMIRAGRRSAGYWEVDVRSGGRFRVELRRWPTEAGAAIRGLPEATVVRHGAIDPDSRHWYEGGAALAITSARLTIAGVSHTRPVEPDAQSACFELDLKPGYDEWRAAFVEEGSGVTRGAYYVLVTGIDPPGDAGDQRPGS